MHTKKVLYIPDYVAGVGGVIMVAKQLEGNKKSLEKELDKIFTRTLSLLNHSSKLRKPPFVVAEQQLSEKQKKVKSQ
jgi:glutamate dehydrogenase/leucine dehydrogenase